MLFVDRCLHRYGLTHIPSHAPTDACFFPFFIPFLNVCPGIYFWLQQLYSFGGLTCVCITAVSHWVAHWLRRLSFGMIRPQKHLVEVFLEAWLPVVERSGGWSWKEVGSLEDYIVSYKSKCNECQPTGSFNSSQILLGIGVLCTAAGDSNGAAICSKSVCICFYVYRDTSWWMTANISFVIKIQKTFFDGKDVWWSLSEVITGILYESHANDQVVLYC
jgi:hypothetical protein